MVRVLPVALLTTLVAALPANAADPDQDAIQGAQRSIAWLEGYSCPKANTPIEVSGLEDDSAVRRTRETTWQYAQGRIAAVRESLDARRQIEAELNGSRPGSGLQRTMAGLDRAIAGTTARATSSLVKWTLATWVDMSRRDPAYTPMAGVQSYPLDRYVSDRAQLATIVGQLGEASAPVLRKFDQCLGEMNAEIIEYNAAEIAAARDKAHSASAMGRLVTELDRIATPPEREGGKILSDLRARQQALVVAEGEAEERRRAAASAALRAQLVQRANAGRAVASRYVAMINAGNVEAAISLLHPDVYLSSPQGNTQGRQAVAARMRDAAREGSGTRPEAPELDGEYRIFSRIRSERGSGRIFFSVNAGKIEQIRLVQD